MNPLLKKLLQRHESARKAGQAVMGLEDPEARVASQVEKWTRIAEEIQEPMSDDAVSEVVLELAASSQFPTLEQWERHSFLFDAPNPHTEVVEPGAVPGEEPRPYGGWDLEEPESMGPCCPKDLPSLKK